MITMKISILTIPFWIFSGFAWESTERQSNFWYIINASLFCIGVGSALISLVVAMFCKTNNKGELV